MATYDPALLDALEALPSSYWRGRVWRHMFNDYAPDRINTGGARWNPPGTGAIYTALTRDTALAEGQHQVDIQPRRLYARRVLYEVEAAINSLVDLTSHAAMQSVGLTQAAVMDDNLNACQQIGGAAAWLDRGGLLVPSARDKGHNLVILIASSGLADDLVIVSEELVELRPA